jgi:uncharacterized coiled-coil DUF342 family protein
MDSEKSKEMIRYIKNKDRYNKRAKEYYNKVYYPQHRKELLEKSREQRNKKNKLYIVQKPIVKIETSRDTSLIVSFD